MRPHHDGSTLDSTSDRDFPLRPAVTEVQPPVDNPRDGTELLFQPLKGQYRTELDVPGEHNHPVAQTT
jgi:hypothetical protein